MKINLKEKLIPWMLIAGFVVSLDKLNRMDSEKSQRLQEAINKPYISAGQTINVKRNDGSTYTLVPEQVRNQVDNLDYQIKTGRYVIGK